MAEWETFVEDTLIKLFADELDVAASSLSEVSSPDTVATWDSLASMNLIAAIEEVYVTRLTTAEIMYMNTIGRAREVLRRKGCEV